jgi:hypothetical protein
MASSEPAARRTQRLLGPTVIGWGMTEIGCGVMRSCLDSPEDDRCLASGCALPSYEGKVMDPETGAPVPLRALRLREMSVRRTAEQQTVWVTHGILRAGSADVARGFHPWYLADASQGWHARAVGPGVLWAGTPAPTLPLLREDTPTRRAAQGYVGNTRRPRAWCSRGNRL